MGVGVVDCVVGVDVVVVFGVFFVVLVSLLVLVFFIVLLVLVLVLLLVVVYVYLWCSQVVTNSLHPPAFCFLLPTLLVGG